VDMGHVMTDCMTAAVWPHSVRGTLACETDHGYKPMARALQQ
jgi:hypothetical protein